MEPDLGAAIDLLNVHYQAFETARPYAERTGHTVPADTKSWSEILVALLTGLSGRHRQKGSDLADGSDVKAANCWSAIDTPRFNGCAPAGRTSTASMKQLDLTAFDDIPYMFFVLWDERRPGNVPRCRIWVVDTARDNAFRSMVATWYDQVRSGRIRSTNFQLHPPRNLDIDVIRNTCGNLEYPLLFLAEWRDDSGYEVLVYDLDAMDTGECVPVSQSRHVPRARPAAPRARPWPRSAD